jgi:hypothetical protein
MGWRGALRQGVKSNSEGLKARKNSAQGKASEASAALGWRRLKIRIALKGHHKQQVTGLCPALSGRTKLHPSLTQGGAPLRFALPWADLFLPFGQQGHRERQSSGMNRCPLGGYASSG